MGRPGERVRQWRDRHWSGTDEQTVDRDRLGHIETGRVEIRINCYPMHRFCVNSVTFFIFDS